MHTREKKLSSSNFDLDEIKPSNYEHLCSEAGTFGIHNFCVAAEELSTLHAQFSDQLCVCMPAFPLMIIQCISCVFCALSL